MKKLRGRIIGKAKADKYPVEFLGLDVLQADRDHSHGLYQEKSEGKKKNIISRLIM